MKRRILTDLSKVAMAVLATLALTMSTAWAGNPHFVSCGLVPVVDNGTCVRVQGKEAGLGDEEQISIELRATAQCVNPGGKRPQAANKVGIATDTDVPVQNGKADYTVQGCAEFQPECTPPMTVVITDISVCDTTNDICCTP
jgi:hypothetical protein